MSNELQLYATGFVSVDSKILMEETAMSLTKKSGLNPVFTVAKGFAGMSQGATTVEIQIDGAVPSSDFEFMPDQYMRLGTVVDVTVVMAGRQSVHKGFITEANYSHSVNEASKLSMTILAQFSDFE